MDTLFEGFKATRYQVNEDITIELREDRTDRWAVIKSGSCLNTDLEWEYEPFPSSRDEDYLKRTRMSLEDARKLIKRKYVVKNYIHEYWYISRAYPYKFTDDVYVLEEKIYFKIESYKDWHEHLISCKGREISYYKHIKTTMVV